MSQSLFEKLKKFRFWGFTPDPHWGSTPGPRIELHQIENNMAFENLKKMSHYISKNSKERLSLDI
jgi:hypothetical protein